MMFQIQLALRYLAGRKLRTFLTLLAVIFGVTLIVGFNGILPAMQQALQGNLSAAAGQVDLTVSSTTRGAFEAGIADQVRQTEGIELVASALVRPVAVPASQALTTLDGNPVGIFLVYGVEPEQAAQIESFTLASGRFLQPGDTNQVVISSKLAEQTGLTLANTLSLPSTTGVMAFEIVGMVSGRPPQGSEELFIPLATAQQLFNLPEQINTIQAQFTEGSNPETVQQAVLAQLGEGFKVGGHTAGSEFEAALEAGNYIYNLFGVVAICLGGFIIFITFRTVVVERRRDIGLLRAIGAGRGTILGMILAETMLLGIIGTAVGLGGGYLMAYGLLSGMRSIMQEFLNAQVGSPSFPAWVFPLAIGLGVGITIVAGIVPALAATKISPLQALRPNTAEVERRNAGRGALVGVGLMIAAFLTLLTGEVSWSALGILLFMVGLSLLGPALIYPVAKLFTVLLSLMFATEGTLAQGNVTRQASRSAITASAITIGLSLLVALGGLLVSLMGGMDEWLDKTLGSDYLLMPQSLMLGGGNVAAGPQMVEEMAAVPGVEAITSLRLSTTRIGGADVQVIGLNPQTYPQVASLIYSQGDEATAVADLENGRNIIVNGILAAQNGINMGDTLAIQTAEGVQQYHVIAIAGDFLNYKLATTYISQENLAQDFKETNDVLVMVNQTATADPAAVESQLKEIASRYPAFNFFSLAEWEAEMGKTLAAFNGMYVMLVVLALPSLIALINTLAISVLERTREIGTLRAVGATRRQIRRLITAESLLLAATGTLFGLLSGLWLSYVLVGAMNFVGLTFTFSFSFAGIILAVVVGLGFGIVGALIPARQAAQLDIVRALAYE